MPGRLTLALLLTLCGCAARAPRGTNGDELHRAREELRQLRRDRKRLQRELKQLREKLRRQKAIVEVARSLQRVRGLPLKHPLKVRFVDKDEARRRMREELKRDAPADYVEGYVATLARLGLLPPRYPMRQELLELMGEQVAGFYDARTRQLFVRRDMPAGELILSHEIAHALQDQSFSLRALQGEQLDQEDRGFAVRALVEGDATVAMLEHLRRTMTLWKALRMLPDLFTSMALDDARLQAAPPYIRESLVQPYVRGMALVQVLRKLGGWARVDRALRKPPVSSEQVLHPEKYLLDERPELRDLPASCGGANVGTVLHQNTLGEFAISVLLEQHTGKSMAIRAATGWSGDRLRSYRRADGSLLLVWLTAWDSLEDAREFARALAQHLDQRYTRRRAGRPLWEAEQGLALIRLRRRRVLLLDGVTPGEARTLPRRCGVGGAAQPSKR